MRLTPSAEFGQFLQILTNNGIQPKLLFTSEPRVTKVIGYKHLVHVVAPAGSTGSSIGDVCLTFDGFGWSVEKHAIAI